MIPNNMAEKISAIQKLKEQHNVAILAHYYTRAEVQHVADVLGDSLALSIAAQTRPEKVILFAGVNFMGQTAKVLCPEKKVLLPRPDATCSLADSCAAHELQKLKEQHPNHLVVSYVNTSVEVKALTDICCTSSNAVKVIESIPAEQPIIFAPDRNLGSYLQKLTGRTNMLVWDGACHVHEEFSLEALLELKKEHPTAKVVAHPECRAYILEVADFVGSTAAILEFCKSDPSTQFIVVTEAGILFELEAQSPDKSFIPAPPMDSTCGCNECRYMKMITLDDIIATLQSGGNEVVIEEQLRKSAAGSIERMVAIK